MKILNEMAKPSVSVWWYINDQFAGIEVDVDIGDITSVGGRFINAAVDHWDLWSDIQKEYNIPSYIEYDYYPRGRVIFDALIHKYKVIGDACCVNNVGFQDAIKFYYKLPSTTLFDTDDHYTCKDCINS